MKNYYNYKTYFTGTPKDIEDAPYIFIINSSEFTEKISLDNLDLVLKDVLQDNHIKSYQSNYKTSDYYEINIDSLFSFDKILFYNGSEIIGYTDFPTSQNLYSEYDNDYIIPILKIYIYINQINKEVSSEIELENSLINVSFKIAYNPGEKENEYITKNSALDFINNEKPDGYLKFTSRLDPFKKDLCQNIITDSNIIYHKGTDIKSNKFFVYSGININSSFDIIDIGLHKNDIVLFIYNSNTNEYLVESLTKQNKFNNQYNYYSGSIKNFISGYEYYYFSGSYIVFKNSYTRTFLVYLMEEQKYYIISESYPTYNNYLNINPLDPEEKISYITSTELTKYIDSTCFIPRNFNDNFYFKKRLGDWWKFTYKNMGYLISKYSYIIYDPNDINEDELYFINSRLLLYRLKTETSYIYKFIPIELGDYYNISTKEIKNSNNELIDFSIDTSINYYSLEPTYKCIIDGIRKKPLRLNNLPSTEIIKTFCGILFYIEDNTLYCF